MNQWMPREQDTSAFEGTEREVNSLRFTPGPKVARWRRWVYRFGHRVERLGLWLQGAWK